MQNSSKQQYIEYAHKAKNKEFYPSLEWCQENCTLTEAANLWHNYGTEEFKVYLEIFRNTKIKNWENFITPEEFIAKKQKIFSDKKQKVLAAKSRGGIASQSQELKNKLLKPLSFTHTSGICITVLPCLTVREIATELNKISYVHYTNLSRLILGINHSTKGWKLLH